MFGKIVGRFFLKQDLGLKDDATPETITISEIMETYHGWGAWIASQGNFKYKQLFTMFETSDVHPDIVTEMKKFHRVIVPYDYLKDILVGHGVNCVALNEYTTPLVRNRPRVIPKKVNPEKLAFLYVGTHDIRKNVGVLARAFEKFSRGTDHVLIVKTNKTDGLPVSENIKYITNRCTEQQLCVLYNLSDFVISTTRGEGVGMPFLEAQYFDKPVIAHTGGVMGTLAKQYDKWIPLPCEEVPIPEEGVPPFLRKVFHGTWWEVREEDVLKSLERVLENEDHVRDMCV
jgi:glycosyltransferase involved in cell wall biosynthesis